MRETRGGQAVAILAAVNGAIMLLRFSEQCLLARALGAGERFDAYFIGQIVILLGGQLTVAATSAAVPILADAGENAASAARRLLWITGTALVFISLSIALLSRPIISSMGGTLDSESRLLARSIFLWLTPATAACILAAVARAYWHTQRKFIMPGIGQLFMPICTCAGALLVTLHFWNLTYAAAVANVGAFALLVVLVRPLLMSNIRDVEVGTYPQQKNVPRRFWMSLLPVSVGLALMPGMVVAARSFAASLTPGSVTAISLAASLGSIPAQFAAASVGVVLLSQTSLLKAAGRLNDGAKVIERALCNTAFVITPCAIVLLLRSKDVVEIIFQRGAFDMAAVGMTASALRAYSVGIPAQAAVQVVTFALFAVSGSRWVAVMSGVTLAVNVVLSQLLLPWGLTGIAGAFSLASLFDCIVLFWLLARALSFLQVRSLLVRHLRILAISIAAAGIATLIAGRLETGHRLMDFITFLMIGCSGYLGINRLVRGPEMPEIIGTLRSRVSRFGRVEALSALK